MSHVRTTGALLTALLLATASPAAAGPQKWVGTWGTAPAPAAPDGISRTGFADRTVRMTAHTSVGGNEIRLRLSNAYGTSPLVLGRVTVGLATASGGSEAVPGSLRPVTFGGAPGTRVAAGAQTVSDPLPDDVPAGADLLVSVYLPEPTGSRSRPRTSPNPATTRARQRRRPSPARRPPGSS